MAHTRNNSAPRMPFTTPVMPQDAYRELTQQTSTKTSTHTNTVNPSRSQAPTLAVITGFDNPRTPPAPGHGFSSAKKHKRNESLQDRRAAKTTLEITHPAGVELSPSDGIVPIGFEEALSQLKVKPTAQRSLNIESHTMHLVSPIAPSIIVTGIPKEGENMSDHFLRPVDPRHRSSIYSQSTNVRQLTSQHRGSNESTPPVPNIPHDILGAGRAAFSPTDSARISSWNTDIDDDDHSITYVGSVKPFIEDLKVTLIERSDTVATKHRSQGWWNHITTPFLPGSAALRGLFPRSPALHSSKSSPKYSPKPPSVSGSGHALSEANVDTLGRDVSSPALNPTTPHLADTKRGTMGFFGDATPKEATFPPLPPRPKEYVQDKAPMSPEFVDPGPNGLGADYYHSFLHDEHSEEAYFPCVNHNCDRWNTQHLLKAPGSTVDLPVTDATDRSFHNLMADDPSTHSSHAAAKVLPALPLISTPSDISNSPSLADHLQPSDSISQVAERRAETESQKARGIPQPPEQQVHRQTTFSDEIGSPEVAEATAMPIMRAVTPEPMGVSESRSRSASAEGAPIAKAVPVMITAPAASTAPRAIAEAVPVPPPASRVPYPESVVSAPPSEHEAPLLSQSRAVAPYPDSPRGAMVAMLPVQETSRNVGTFVSGPEDSISPAAASHYGPPPASAVEHYTDIGMVRSMPLDRSMPTPLPPPESQENLSRSGPAQTPRAGVEADRGAPTAMSSRNPLRRHDWPVLAVPHSPQPPSAASPGAYTPTMVREAQIGAAVPMQAHQAAPDATAPTATEGFTRRAMMERYDIRHSTPQATNPDPHTPFPPPAFIPAQHQQGSTQDLESSRSFNEKTEHILPPRPAKRPSNLSLVLAKWREGRAQRTPETRRKQKHRRCCCFSFWALFFLVLLIVLLVMLLTVPRSSGIPVQSSWLNLTNYPPIPTGVATIARANNVRTQSGCVAPQTMWSCAVPQEMQAGILPNDPDQPDWRFVIRFLNGTALSNGTVVNSTGTSNNTLAARGNPWNPNPAPPSDADQMFLGNTTDGNLAPFDGEETPFYISFLPTTTTSGASKRDVSKDFSSSSDSDASSSIASSASSSTASRTTTSSTPSSASTSDTSDPLSAIPSPSLNPDGSPASASLYPLPTSQPLRLYNRGTPTEHFGFYTYFDRTIFLSSIDPSNGTITSSSSSSSSTDSPGGSNASSANYACTFSQTRFLVQIWTSNNMTGGSNATGQVVGGRQLLNGSAIAEAAAQGNITANSGSSWAQPGSFPYPVTVTVDRHGGVAKEKLVYCYGLDGTGGKVNVTDKVVVLENRGYGGTLIDGAGGLLSSGNETAPIDGGTGGCACGWQNWESA